MEDESKGLWIARSDPWRMISKIPTSIREILNEVFLPSKTMNSILNFSCHVSVLFSAGAPDKELTALLAEAQVHLAAGQLTPFKGIGRVISPSAFGI